MAKSADAFRTISEVAEWLEVPAHVLRFWESKFTQVKPVKRAGGRRYYRPADMRLLAGIKLLLHDEGMTIKGVQKMLREEGVRHVSSLAAPFEGETQSAAPDDTPVGQVLSFARRNATADNAAEAAPEEAPNDTGQTPDEAPEAADAAPEARPEPPADTATEPEPEAPATRPEPAPLPDLMPDPPDDIAAEPGALGRLAALPRPLPAQVAARLAEIAREIRARDDAPR